MCRWRWYTLLIPLAKHFHCIVILHTETWNTHMHKQDLYTYVWRDVGARGIHSTSLHVHIVVFLCQHLFQFLPIRRERMHTTTERKSVALSVICVWPLSALQVENIWTSYKGTGVITVTLFQATNHILDGARLVTHHPTKMEEKLVLAVFVYPELYESGTVTAETEKPLCVCEWIWMLCFYHSMSCKLVVLCN